MPTDTMKIAAEAAERAIIDEACTRAKLPPHVVENIVYKAFARAEFTPETVDSYLANLIAKVPELVATPAATETEAESADKAAALAELETRCFEGKGVSARGQLVKLLGSEDAADARARAWGLTGLHDYKTAGTRPADSKPADKSAKPKKPPAATNPFSREGWNISEQGRIARVMGIDKAAALAKAAGVKIGATRPAEAA